MNISKVAAFGLILGVSAALAGCSADSDGGEEGTVDAVIWHDWDANGPAQLALLTTTLVLENGCLQGQDGLIAFPRGFGEWDADNEELTFGDVVYAPGDEISAGGGGGAITEDMTVPTGCDAAVGDSVFIVQSTTLS